MINLVVVFLFQDRLCWYLRDHVCDGACFAHEGTYMYMYVMYRSHSLAGGSGAYAVCSLVCVCVTVVLHVHTTDRRCEGAGHTDGARSRQHLTVARLVL